MMNKKKLPHIITAVSLVVFIILGLACATTPNPTKFNNFQDDPKYRGQFVGIWITDPNKINGQYGVAEYNDDGTGTETLYSKNNDVVLSIPFSYKTSSHQMAMLAGGNGIVWNYKFTDNNTFSIRSSPHSFIYRRVPE